jgi:hypothetical protein
MKANVGPNKSAVMLFAPERAQRPLQAGEIVWGSEPLPVVDKYLGVMLATDCTWQAHVEYVVTKATKASYAMPAGRSQVGYGDTQGAWYC